MAWLLCISMSYVLLWVGNHLLLTLLIFFKIVEKKHDSSAKFLCTHFCNQRFSPYIIDIHFLLSFSSHFSRFSYFFVFFFFSSLNLDTYSLVCLFLYFSCKHMTRAVFLKVMRFYNLKVISFIYMFSNSFFQNIHFLLSEAAIQRCSVKIVRKIFRDFTRKYLWQSPMDSSKSFFTPEHSQTATSVLPLIKLQFSTKSWFYLVSSRTFFIESLFLKPFTLLACITGNCCTFLQVPFLFANMMVSFFINT